MYNKKTWIIFIILFLQTTVALVAGSLSYFYINRDNIEPGIVLFNQDITDMQSNELKQLLNENAHINMVNTNYTLVIADNEYNMSLDKLGAYYDFDALLKQKEDILLNKEATIFDMILSVAGLWNVKIITPYAIDKEQLKITLKDIADNIEKEPVDAVISISGNDVIKSECVDGINLDIDKASLHIIDHLYNSDDLNIKINDETRGYFVKKPARCLSYFDGIDSVIASGIVNIDGVNKAVVDKFISQFDGNILERYDGKNGVFIFPDMDVLNNVISEPDYQFLLKAASSFYTVVLKTGIDVESIMREQNLVLSDFLTPGLDVKIDGSEFSFKNTLGYEVIIEVLLDKGELEFMILGPDIKKEYQVESEIIDEIEPGLIKIKDSSVPEDKELLVSEGKKGLRVNVYRICYELDGGNTSEADRVFLYDNVYEPISRIIKLKDPHLITTK